MSSILDVAREAKVSPSTVSLVLNHGHRVSDQTRQKVKRAIENTAYKPRDARRLQKRHVAVLYSPTLTYSGSMIDYCRQWIAGIQDMFQKDGVFVTVLPAGLEDNPGMFLRGLEQHDYDGVICMGLNTDHQCIGEAIEQPIPVIAINRPGEEERGISSVSHNFTQVGQIAADCLLAQGHQRIATGFNSTDNRTVNRIKSGFANQLAAAGVVLIETPTLSEPDLAQWIRSEGITGFFWGDPQSQRLGNHLIEIGASIPEDVSLVGFDALGLDFTNGRRLTSIGYDAQVMGYQAGQMMEKLLGTPGAVTAMSAVLPTHLVNGSSVSAAP